MTEASEQLAGDDARGAARPPHLEHTRREGRGFVPQQGVLIAGRDQTMGDHDAREGQGVACRLKRGINGHS
jgi:hypothetical protein